MATTSVNANKPVGSPPRSAAPGVKIVFSDNSGPKQTLYYFSTDPADGSFDRSGFSAFLTKLGPADSLIKSASYLLHNSHFASVRKLLLDRSATILQDDSGIPLAYFEPKKWRRQAFGIMQGPSQSSQTSTSPKWRRCFKVQIRLNSGLDTDGARTSSTCSLRTRSRHQIAMQS